MRDEFYEYTISASTNAGGTGTSADTPQLRGTLWGFVLDYSSSAASTTDVTIKARVAETTVTLLTITDNNTDGYYPLQIQAKLPNNSSAGYTQYILTGDRIFFEIAQGGTSVTDCVKLTVKVA